MPNLYDSVKADNILASCDNVSGYAGYIDGRISKWTEGEWHRMAAKFPNANIVRISVLANPLALTFDYEKGNASIYDIRMAIQSRLSAGLKSIIYCALKNTDYIGALFRTDILNENIYLHIANWINGIPTPSEIENFFKTHTGCVAWQYQSNKEYDISTIDASKFPYWNSAPTPSPVIGSMTLQNNHYSITKEQ